MKKIYYILLFSLALLPLSGIGQARIFINSGYIVMANGTASQRTLLVVHNSATNAITLNGGGITSEREYNMVQWDIGTAAAASNYVVPFYYYPSLSYIPVTLTIGTAGIGSGTIRFSTWHTINDNWVGTMTSSTNTGPPHDVTNMSAGTGASPGGASHDNSYNVVDRFWVVDANGIYYNNGVQEKYTTTPDPQLTFSYLNHTNGSTEVGGLNNSIDNTLIAQRFDTISNKWGDYNGPTGTTVISGTVSSVSTTGSPDVLAANGFFRSWTLASSNVPLPIVLTSFTAECQNFAAHIQWDVATQTDNNFFTVERSPDGINYQTVAVVKGAGTTGTAITYTAVDETPLSGISYYRLSQTDMDGTTTHVKTIVYQPCGNEPTQNAFVTNQTSVVVQINSLANDEYNITLMNMLGQPVFTENKAVAVGNNTFILPTNVSDGVYILSLKSDKANYVKRLYIGR